MNEYYVYAWFYKSSGIVFYIGKGKGNRYCDIVHSRNAYFKNILSCHKDDVDVKFLLTNLTNEDAANKERELIKEYKDRGECKANFHEGGFGGNTGNYDNPERSRKLSEATKRRNLVGANNPMYGKHHTPEAREKIRQAGIGKKISPEHIARLIAINKSRKMTDEQKERLRQIHKGKKVTREQYIKMMDRECKYRYIVTDNDETIMVCHSIKHLVRSLKPMGLSKTIIEQMIKGEWKPKFNRHMHLINMKITRVDKGVSTMGDEFSPVE